MYREGVNEVFTPNSIAAAPAECLIRDVESDAFSESASEGRIASWPN
jgi:hypothetical protein